MLLTFLVFVGYGLFAAKVRAHVISRPKVADLDAADVCRSLRRARRKTRNVGEVRKWPGSCRERSRSSPGRATASAAASPRCSPSEGAKTVLVARRAELLDEVAAGIKAKGGEALAHPADLTKGGRDRRAVPEDHADLRPARRAHQQRRHRHPQEHRGHHARLLERGDGHQHHRAVSLRARGDPHHEGADAAGRAHRQYRQRVGEDAAAGFAALYGDQVRPAGHDAPADDGRAQAQDRRRRSSIPARRCRRSRRGAGGPRRATATSPATTTSWPPRTWPRSRC